MIPFFFFPSYYFFRDIFPSIWLSPCYLYRLLIALRPNTVNTLNIPTRHSHHLDTSSGKVVEEVEEVWQEKESTWAAANARNRANYLSQPLPLPGGCSWFGLEVPRTHRLCTSCNIVPGCGKDYGHGIPYGIGIWPRHVPELWLGCPFFVCWLVGWLVFQKRDVISNLIAIGFRSIYGWINGVVLYLLFGTMEGEKEKGKKKKSQNP